MPDRREGTRGEGALPESVSRLRGAHGATERQGRRRRVLQTLPSRRDRGPPDDGAGARRHVRLARPVWQAADVVRLVAYARAPAWRRALQRLSTGDWPSAGVVTAVYGNWTAARPAAAKQLDKAGGEIDGRGSVVPDDHGRPGGRSSPIADPTRATVQEAADTGRDSGPEALYLEGSPFQRRLKRSAVS